MDAGQKPCISIIVPVYNAQRYLDECLTSLTNQTFQLIEIICVDDGSTDRSLSILQSYADKDNRVRVFSKENGGAASARNFGLDHVRGDYVLFVDSDDFIALHTCKTLFDIARRDGADIVVFGGKTFPSVLWKDEAFAHSYATFSGDDVIRALFDETGSRPFMCNKLYSQAMLESCGARFNEEFVLGEDHAFQFTVFPHAETVSYIGDQLYFYRGHDESLVARSEFNYDVLSQRHCAIVEYVVRTWMNLGIARKHGRSLVAWLTLFLHDSMRYTSFNVRCEVAARLKTLASEAFDAQAFDTLDGPTRRKYDFMTTCNEAADAIPFIAFVFDSSIGEQLKPEALLSCLQQSEQRIECIVASRCVTDELASIIDADKRCRVADFKELSDVAQSCSALYILPVSCNCRFDEDFARDAIGFLDYLGIREPGVASNAPQPADVVVVWERFRSVRYEDAFENFDVDDLPLYRGTDVIALPSIRQRAFCVFSLAMGNKMYRKGFLTQQADAVKETAGRFSLAAQLLLAAAHAETVVTLRVPLLTCDEFDFGAEGESATADTAPLKQHIDELLACGEFVDEDMRGGYYAALAQYCLTVDELIRPLGYYQAAYALIAEGVRQSLGKVGDASPSLDPLDREHMERLVSKEALAHYEWKAQGLNTRVESVIAKLTYDVWALLGKSERLAFEYDLVTKSRFYRASAAVYNPLRNAYQTLKAIRRR